MSSAILVLSACLILKGAFIVSIPICQNSGYCKNSADCYPGNKCGNIHDNLYYSQCIADPNTYSTVPGCLTNFGRMCTATSQCCDPGSSCDLSDKYPQCKQPTAATGLKATLKFYKKQILSIDNKTIIISVSSRLHLLISLYVLSGSGLCTSGVAFSTYSPSAAPSSIKPTAQPSKKPSSKPTAQPSKKPSSKPTAQPSKIPSSKPTATPSQVNHPSCKRYG